MGKLPAKIFGLVAVVGAAVFTCGNANAVIIQYPNAGFMGASELTWFDTPTPAGATIVEGYFYNPSISPQNPAAVELALEAASAFNQGLTFVGGGACGGALCTAFDLGDPNGNAGTSSISGDIYGVHFDNRFVALLYDQALTFFRIDGLRFGVSNIYVFNTGGQPGTLIPLPAALPLFGTALVGLGFLGWRRKRRAA